MSVQTFGTNILDVKVKSLEAQSRGVFQNNVEIFAYDPKNTNGTGGPISAGTAGLDNAFISLGSNTANKPFYMVGTDTQYTAGNPNRGKLSLYPNVGTAGDNYESHETMGIGYDSTVKGLNIAPTGAWIRSKDGADGFNAAFTLTNNPNSLVSPTPQVGVYYSHVLNRPSVANPNQYNLFIQNAGNSQSLIKCNPISATDNDITIGDISSQVIINNFKFAGVSGALVSGTPSLVTVPVAGMTANAIVLLTQNSGATPATDVKYIAALNSFQISVSTANTCTFAYFVVKL